MGCTGGLDSRGGAALERPLEEYRPFERSFAIGLVAILFGYAFLGRGFAYLHVPVGFPLYVGEIVLVLGVGSILLSPDLRLPLFNNWPCIIAASFLTLGVVGTVPYLEEHGIDAVRDAATYYYAAFMFLVLGLIRSREQLQRIAGSYGRFAPWLVLWVPISLVLYRTMSAALPRSPFSETPLLGFKGGDMAVHLIGALAFMHLVERPSGSDHHGSWGLSWHLAGLLSAVCLMGRAAYLAVACGLSVALGLGEKTKRWKPLLAGLLAVAIFMAVDPRIQFEHGREISVDTAIGLVRSIFTDVEEGSIGEGSKRWRLMWWTDIVEETFGGEYFWTGRGFGVNLADIHGFQTYAGSSAPLRSPHNGHMTILARMGVPGFFLWILLQLSLAWHFYSGWRRARDAGDRLVQGILAWVLCYWVAAMVNASFDVYLEGPQGAIWFWSVMGVGLAASKTEAMKD